MRLNLTRDTVSDVILHGEDVANLAVIAFGPEMTAGYCVDELCADAQPLAAPAYAAFEDLTHAKVAGDLFHINCAALVDECRVAGDDE